MNNYLGVASKPLRGALRHVKPSSFSRALIESQGQGHTQVRQLYAPISRDGVKFPPESTIPSNEQDLRYPRSVQGLYLRPLRREAEYGIPACDLQLRSYSVRSLEFFADFALRAAYYLNLPAFGPVPLPRITERWTVPRSSFIFKKSQENFERITMRRLIQIRDGNPETVQIWLGFLQKYAYAGVGMKANVWEFGKLAPSDKMAARIPQELEDKWSHLGLDRSFESPDIVESLLRSGRSNTMGA